MTKILSFLNLQNILTVVGFAGVFYLTSEIRSCQNKKELNRLDKVIAKQATTIRKDSTIIANLQKDTSDCRQTLIVSDENIKELQILIKSLNVSIKGLKGEILISKESLKKAIDAGSIICDTLVLERKQKLLSNKYYYIILDKPENLRELIRE